MTLTSDDLKYLRENLPYGSISEIAESVKKPNGESISYRMVQYILSGKRSDQFGVIDKALEIARKSNERTAKIKKQITKLKK